jgi:hypothetical protein
VTYEVNITNTGPNNVTLTNASDDKYPDVNLTSLGLVGTVLEPDENVTVFFDGEASEVFDASKTNTFTIEGVDDDNDPATASDDATVLSPPEPVEEVCPRTPGFWKTHNGEFAKGNNFDLTTGAGPTESLLPVTLGNGSASVLIDSDADVNAVFNAELTADSAKSNGVSKLYVHLLAAKFNVENGANTPANVLTAIERSDEILGEYDESDWKDLRKDDKELAQEIGDLKDLLDEFNNGAYASEDCIEDFWKMEA